MLENAAGSYRPETYKDPALVAGLRTRIATLAEQIGRPVKLMHICGTHEHEIGRYALRDLLPDSVTVLAGPGCPVCVCDTEYIDTAIALSLTPGVILASFGDMLAVPGSIPLQGERRGDVRMSLLDARAQGGDVRAVYSVFDAARLAERTPDAEVVFFSVGFETTVVAVAAMLARGAPDNLSIIEANYYTPPATRILPDLDGFDVDGFILPGHAATITGLRVYEPLAERGIACACGGFEPVDVMAAVASLLEQIRDGAPTVANPYQRLVKYDGNERAQRELDEVFALVPIRWRGIAEIPASGYALRPPYQRHSAAHRFAGTLAARSTEGTEHPAGCRCAEVTLGQIRPDQCRVFGVRCTPDSPYGPCMVSHEGTCRAWYVYGMHKERLHVEPA
ncbi:MAG: hydrogenase formation protein HypD [Trueperaceae bacterium]|nr:hydrogenase formation protein HypD [Trueperaceae bacterium]